MTDGDNYAANDYIRCVDELKRLALAGEFPMHVHVRLSVLPQYSKDDRLYICVIDTRGTVNPILDYVIFDVLIGRAKHVWQTHVEDMQDALFVLHDLLKKVPKDGVAAVPDDAAQFSLIMDAAAGTINHVTFFHSDKKTTPVVLDMQSLTDKITVTIKDPVLNATTTHV